MRRRLTGNIHAPLFRPSYKLDALLCRNVADMVFTSCFFAKFKISFYHGIFAFGGYASVAVFFCIAPVVDISRKKQAFVLAVSRQHPAEALCFKHGLFHHLGRLNTLSVVGKSANKGRQLLHIRKLPALFPFCDCAEGINVNNGIFFYNAQLHIKMLLAVGSGI